ncbi:hypothetical protein DJ031_11765 [bacterium endosymbiont of Escarpia laminata]|nr:MAG: hypothetical protein DJ031_11765 [bacterium endosymbiont of Escarpia laminata]
MAPVVDAGPDQTINEGDTASFNGSFTDPGSADTHTVEWNFGDGPSASGGLSQTHTYAEDGIYTVTDDEGASGSDTLQIGVDAANVGPTADAGGPYVINEGNGITLDGSASNDPDSGPQPMSYAWDLDGDGQYDDATGAQVTLPVQADDTIFSASLKVSDGLLENTDTTTVTVSDLAPTAALTGDTRLNEGQAGSYDAGGSISSPDAIVSYEWDWRYDGVTFTRSGDTGVTQSHTWNSTDSYTVAVRVADDDGSMDLATLTVTVQATAVQTVFDVTARAKPTEVFVIWTPVTGADSYNVYRSTTAGGPYTQIGYVCDYCSYWDQGLTNGVTYYYVVTSVSGGAESLPSNEAFATPQIERTRRRR